MCSCTPAVALQSPATCCAAPCHFLLVLLLVLLLLSLLVVLQVKNFKQSFPKIASTCRVEWVLNEVDLQGRKVSRRRLGLCAGSLQQTSCIITNISHFLERPWASFAACPPFGQALLPAPWLPWVMCLSCTMLRCLGPGPVHCSTPNHDLLWPHKRSTVPALHPLLFFFWSPAHRRLLSPAYLARSTPLPHTTTNHTNPPPLLLPCLPTQPDHAAAKARLYPMAVIGDIVNDLPELSNFYQVRIWT